MTNPFDPDLTYRAKSSNTEKSKDEVDLTWRVGLIALTIFSAFLYLYKLASGQRSEYYAAIAVSMSKSFSNFLFGALDPAGTVSLDKIPGGYWVPALFVKIFGFNTWSVTAPNALAAIATVIVVAILVRRIWGTYPGLFAGLAMASTPIFVAVSRSNQAQTFFVLALALAADRASVALQNGSRRSLIWAGIWIGVAFQVWMLPAWAIWPALIAAWLIAAPVVWVERVKSLLIAGSASLLFSLSWIILVSLTPASNRPYVGGTYHNNAWEMVFGYNGLGRFSSTSGLSEATDDPTFRSFTPPFGGESGIGRIFSQQVAGQIAWLLPLAFISAILFIVVAIRHRNLKEFNGNIIFAFGWLITLFAMFSAVAGMHQFYVTSMAIPAILLIAAAGTYLFKKADRTAKIVTAGALIFSTGWSAFLSNRYDDYLSWTVMAGIVITLVAVVIIFANNLRAIKFGLFAAVVSSLLLTPTAWSIDVNHRSNSINPIAGPESGFGDRGGAGNFNKMMNGAPPQGMTPPGNGNFDRHKFGQGGRGNFDPNHIDPGNQPPGFAGGGAGGLQIPDSDTATVNDSNSNRGAMGGMNSANTELIKYLTDNRNGSKFLLATFGGTSAAPYITATGENVLPIGGFDGQDPTPTLAQFKKMISSGELKFVLSGGGGNRGANSNNEIQSWVSSNCTIDSAAPAQIYLCSASN